MIRAEDPFEAAQNIPGQAGVEIFLNAARRVGAPPAAVEQVRRAYTEYRDLARVHAADKASFEAMLSRYAGPAGERADIEARRAAYRANAHLFGIQAAVQLRADFLRPARSGNPALVDIASVRGFCDLVRTRPGVWWPVSRQVSKTDQDAVRRHAGREPIDPPVEIGGGDSVPLLRGFCSNPLPGLRTVSTAEGQPEAVLVEGAIGNTGAASIVTGEVIRDSAPAWRTETDRVMGIASRCFTPCEFLQCDYFVHRSLFGRMDPRAFVVSELHRPALAREEAQWVTVPCGERVKYLGSGLDALSASAVPRYSALAAHVFERVGWAAGEFDVYRVGIEYPVVPSCLFLQHDLPEPPSRA